MEAERKPGWYWVKVDNFKFEPMQWVDTGRLAFFKHNGSPLGTQPRNEDVGPRIPAPDEPWQTVPLVPTGAMVDEGWKWIDIRHKWKEMLAVAPKP